MLDGFWTIDITDFRGLQARGLALLHDGIVLADGEALDIAGTYEEQGNAILAALDVVLRGRDASNRPVAERVRLHVQGRAMGHVVSASGVDLADAGRRADVRLERRAVLERGPARMPTSPTGAQPGAPTSAMTDATRSDARASAPRLHFAKARLPGEVRAEARQAIAAMALRQRGTMPPFRPATACAADDALAELRRS